MNCQGKLEDSACGQCSSCLKIKNNSHEYTDYIFHGRIPTTIGAMSDVVTPV